MTDESSRDYILVKSTTLCAKNEKLHHFLDLPYFQQSSLSKSRQKYKTIYKENSCSCIKVLS